MQKFKCVDVWNAFARRVLSKETIAHNAHGIGGCYGYKNTTLYSKLDIQQLKIIASNFA